MDGVGVLSPYPIAELLSVDFGTPNATSTQLWNVSEIYFSSASTKCEEIALVEVQIHTRLLVDWTSRDLSVNEG